MSALIENPALPGAPEPPSPAGRGWLPYGTRDLLALAWRRDRVMLGLAWAGLIALSVGSAQATRALYPDAAAAAEQLGGVLNNPSVIALYGPVGSSSLDALSVFKTVMLGACFVAVLGLVVVRRHTRAEEDEGRLELLESAAVARRAPLMAALILAVAAVLIPSAVSALGLVAIGQDPWGSIAFGVAWASAGLGTIGITAVASQIAPTSRTTSGLAFGVLAIGYLLRVLGDTRESLSWLSWLSPIGWAGRVIPYGENRIGVLALGLLACIAGARASFALLARRDLGSGLLAARPGPARAAAWLDGPFALVLRQARGVVIGWSIAMLIGGVLVASLLSAVGQLGENEAVAKVLASLGGGAGSLEDIYLAAELQIIAVAVSAAAIGIALRLASAERAGLADVVLAAGTSRSRWYGASAAGALGLPVLLMTLLGVALGLFARPLGGGAAPGLADAVGAALATVPAIWCCVAVALALVGVSPRFAPGAWVGLLLAFVIAELGPSMGLAPWLVWLSPFHHLSQLPGGSFNLAATLALSAVAAAAVGLGAVAFTRRDIG